MYIFGDSTRKTLVIFLLSVFIPLFVITSSMPLRKKVVTEIMTSVGENHRPEPSTDHISMHSKGVEFLGEAGHCESR